MARQVFISYASEDFAIAERVCRALENTATTCWMAPRDIPPGTEYPSAIVDGIRESTVLVAILSAAAVESPHVLTEVGQAFNQKKRIVPFRISNVELPQDLEYFLAMTQWLDAEGGATGANLKRLIAAVRAALRGTETPVTPARFSRAKVWLAGLAALAVSGAGLAYWILTPKATEPRAAPVIQSSKAIEPPAAPGIQSSADPVPPQKKAPAGEPKPTSWVNPADGQTYLWIQPGSFTMGCSPGDDQCEADEKPAHRVKIATGFWMARTEVTVLAYRARKPGGQAQESRGAAPFPMTGVAWEQAKQYCAAVGGRLPSEAEWEYAARGGEASPYYGELNEIAWYAGNSGEEPHAVQTKAANAFGLHDMLGNVGEWVLDRYYNKYYLDAPAVGPTVEQPLAGNASAVVRGAIQRVVAVFSSARHTRSAIAKSSDA